MKFNAYLSLPLQRYPAQAAAPARRWWLGWLQLLGAWLLCMLLCANIALVLAEGLPTDDARSGARNPTRCVVAEGILKPVAARDGTTPQESAPASRCSGV
jgi:hypothetical protein